VAITKLSELKAEIANTLNRSDLTASIPGWISLSEVDIRSRFRTADMQTSTALTMTAGTATLALPADFGELIRFQYTADGQTIEIGNAPFSPMTQGESSGVPGYPRELSIVGSNFVLKPTPNSAFPVLLYYFRNVPALDLTDEDDTNWLLTDYPNVYLYGALLSALPKIGNDVRREIWSQFYEAGLENVKNNDRSKRFAKAPKMRSAVFS